jgi:hypothetical protein
LEPTAFIDLISGSIQRRVDIDQMHHMAQTEFRQKEILQEFGNHSDELVRYVRERFCGHQ